MVASLKELSNSLIPDHYAVVSSPLFRHRFLRQREQFDYCLKEGVVSGLRFINLGSDAAEVVKYQRCLAEQLFSLVLSPDPSDLWVVIKMEVANNRNFEKGIEVFCIVEDVGEGHSPQSLLSEVDESTINFETLSVEKVEEESLEYVNEVSIVNTFLSNYELM